ncbi:hypothetical protein DVS28_a0209 [Euzebya pacifica]|uniref:Uncharacterized protein n=1 Tax=Euzebya pacifica TaxID=1608957 RepID=A0A346XRS0_9ACTN|nr:hypothetical protein DVS28_a0209 [Euzebya pacifica]
MARRYARLRVRCRPQGALVVHERNGAGCADQVADRVADPLS